MQIPQMQKSFSKSLALLGRALAPPLALVVAIATAGSAQAASFEFRPGGAQIDGDVINDLVIGNNQTLDFEVYVDYNDLINEIFAPAPTPADGTNFGTLEAVRFGNAVPGIQWDSAEWIPSSVDITSFSTLSPTPVAPVSTGTSGIPAANPGSLAFFMTSLLNFTTVNDQVFLGTIRGVTQTVEYTPGNGVGDLLLSLVNVQVSGVTYTNGTNGIDFGPTQSLSLQQNEVPGPLPILGAGAAFGFSRKLRNRIKLKAAKA
jgi:hypothetical protein